MESFTQRNAKVPDGSRLTLSFLRLFVAGRCFVLRPFAPSVAGIAGSAFSMDPFRGEVFEEGTLQF